MKKSTYILGGLLLVLLGVGIYLGNGESFQGYFRGQTDAPLIENTVGGGSVKGGSNLGLVIEANTVEALRSGVETANNEGNITINLSEGTFTLTGVSGEDANLEGDIDLYGDVNLTITGAGDELTVISGANVDRLFDVRRNASLTLKDLTLKDGNPGEGEFGGHIYADNAKNIVLENVSLLGGTANKGGAIYFLNVKNFNIEGSAFRNNEATMSNGGAISLESSANNRTNSQGSIASTTFKNNTAYLKGAVLYTGTGVSLELNENLMEANTIQGDVAYTSVSGQPYSFEGGVIYNEGVLSIKSTAIVENEGVQANGAGLGIYNAGTLDLANVTIAENSTGSFPQGEGSAIYNEGSAEIVFSTFSNNIGAESIYNDGDMSIGASLISGGCDLADTVESMGYNVRNYGGSSSCIFRGSGAETDVIGADPLLSGLSEVNGAQLAQFSNAKNSAAVNQVPENVCADFLENSVFDQAGQTRIGWCDSGAFEYQDREAPTIVGKKTSFSYSNTTSLLGVTPAPRWMKDAFPPDGVVDLTGASEAIYAWLLEGGVAAARDNVDDMSLCTVAHQNFRNDFYDVMEYEIFEKEDVNGNLLEVQEFKPGVYKITISMDAVCYTPEDQLLKDADLSGNAVEPLDVTLTILE